MRFAPITVSVSATDEFRPAAATKTCPQCAEEVKTAAVVCRFCGHQFDDHPEEPAFAPGWFMRAHREEKARTRAHRRAPLTAGQLIAILVYSA